MKGKIVSGNKFSSVDEEYKKKQNKKLEKAMVTAGLSKALKKSAKETGYSNAPRLKPQSKKG